MKPGDIAKLPPELEAAEVELRFRRALAHIQNAQTELGRAQSELASLINASAVHALVGKVYDRVHAAWYRVEANRVSGRSRLDGMAVESLRKRLGDRCSCPDCGFRVELSATHCGRCGLLLAGGSPRLRAVPEESSGSKPVDSQEEP